jgi:hypothetical protein
MAKKSTMSKAADAVKTVAADALGAAAGAAAGAVVKKVVEAVQEGGAKLDKAAPALQKTAAAAVSKPILPTPKRSARAKAKAPARKPKRKPVAAKKKSAAKKNMAKRIVPWSSPIVAQWRCRKQARRRRAGPGLGPDHQWAAGSRLYQAERHRG